MAEPKPGEEGAKKKGGSLNLIMLAVNTLLIVGLAVYVFVFSGQEAPKGPAPAGPALPATRPLDKPGPQVNLKEFTANLADASGERFLRCKIVLEVSGPDVEKEIDARQNQVRDRILSYLSSLRFVDTQGLSGKDDIRRGIRSRINALLKSGQVDAVYLTEFIVQ